MKLEHRNDCTEVRIKRFMHVFRAVDYLGTVVLNEEIKIRASMIAFLFLFITFPLRCCVRFFYVDDFFTCIFYFTLYFMRL